MRITSQGKFNSSGNRVIQTIVHCDCGHAVTFDCEPKDAERYLKGNGGTISSNGTTRCKPCTQQHYATMARSLKRMNGG